MTYLDCVDNSSPKFLGFKYSRIAAHSRNSRNIHPSWGKTTSYTVSPAGLGMPEACSVGLRSTTASLPGFEFVGAGQRERESPSHCCTLGYKLAHFLNHNHFAYQSPLYLLSSLPKFAPFCPKFRPISPYYTKLQFSLRNRSIKRLRFLEAANTLVADFFP